MKKILKVPVIALFVILITVPLYLIFTVHDTGLGNGPETIWGKDTQRLTDSVCSECTTDEEKVKAIYGWITRNIEYDYDFEGVYQSYDEEKTLKTRKGICFDYANLFASMCRSQSIPCYILDGYKRTDSTALHTWNRVYFQETWWNIDVTYDSEAKKHGKTCYGFHNIGKVKDLPDEDYVITRIY